MMRAGDALTEEDRAAIEAAVREAEGKTSGEIVPVLAAMSSSYPRAKDRAGMIGAPIVLTAVWLLWPEGGAGWGTVRLPLLTVLLILLGGFMLFRGPTCLSPTVRRLFTLPGERREEVERGAAEAFARFRVHATEGATGVVIYVSLYEGLVAVLGDRAIAEKLHPEEWEAIRDLVLEGIRAGELETGFVNAIRRAGERLAEHFPRASDDVDELGNELRILDG